MKLAKGTVVLTENDAIDVNVWLEQATGYDKLDSLITVKELCDLRDELSEDDFPGIESKWDYPTNEADHISENGLDVVLVRFKSEHYGCGAGDYEYRFCEV